MAYGYLDKEVKALVAERDRLAAERDEWKRRCEEMASILNRQGKCRDLSDAQVINLAIAEGRDNG